MVFISSAKGLTSYVVPCSVYGTMVKTYVLITGCESICTIIMSTTSSVSHFFLR
jgi:hypothetical protein